ncbi:ribitol 5-phosphate transferase FKRP [Hydra vulgaris]|nr:ribitol 5-phosphate transferase FKRP-like [Hydra vulgaris]
MNTTRIKKSYLFIFCICLITLWFVFFYSNQKKTEYLDLTIVIPEFEHFDHNVVETINSIIPFYPDLKILVISSTVPYPYFKLPGYNSQFVIRKKDPRKAGYLSDPFYYINTKYMLVIPDGSRIDIGLNELLEKFKQQSKKVFVLPISTVLSSCNLMEVDLKKWTLKYFEKKKVESCDSFNRQVALLFERSAISNFSDPFLLPFFESFFIQAKVNGLKLHLENTVYISVGKILHTDSHLNSKHLQHVQTLKSNLYKNLGIKYSLNPNGIEAWHGCTKKTQRCFPTVIDVPEYLHEKRWTPPCCLDALRKTARHVFLIFEQANFKYWLEGGSLLGAARYSDIIPWDYDVDIGIFMDQIKEFPMLSKVWKGQRYIDHDGFVWERAEEGEFIRVQYSEMNHLHVDIYPFYERNNVMTKNTWMKNHRQDMEFPSHYVKNLEQLRFAGALAWVPNHYKEFLELKFGKNCIENPQYPFPEKLEHF